MQTTRYAVTRRTWVNRRTRKAVDVGPRPVDGGLGHVDNQIDTLRRTLLVAVLILWHR